jgi:hypothetical protein
MFEYARRRNYLECGDMSPLLMRRKFLTCVAKIATSKVAPPKARTCPRTPKLTPNMNAATRSAIVAVAICSWLAISNHCVFGAIANPVRETRSVCPFHPEPVKPQAPPSGIQCCKILRAVVPMASKSRARDDTKFSDVDLRIDEFVLVAHLHAAPAPLPLDTGPPEALSFAELILQRSLFSHAPPVRV